MAAKKKWIRQAISKPGALRATAKRKKLIKGEGKLTETALGKLAKSKDTTTKRRVNLARTLKKLKK